ncbi:MAG TPA: hypothetical protein VFW87_08270 [Pirellulales bacterium]|nr:hypothetical protein [Pirellulales bacterium]
MATKQGDLRVQTRGVIYGPMTREAMDRLLAGGKLAPSDLVSVRGGKWIEIAAFLVSPAEDTKEEDPELRLLAEQRIFSSLSRRQVEQLRSAGRVGDDDLICALDGPWMRVGDFLAPASPPASDAPAASDCATPPIAGQAAGYQPALTIGQPPLIPMAAMSDGSSVSSETAGRQPVEAPALTRPQPPATEARTPSPKMPGADSGYHTPPALRPGAWLSDVWFVRIRGMHSAPLKKHHLRTLFEARELTPDSPARNDNWPDNAWTPICLIPELADVLK